MLQRARNAVQARLSELQLPLPGPSRHETRTIDITMTDNNATLHEELVGLPDAELLKLAPQATHQHYQGSLYCDLGPLMDADTGEQMTNKDGLLMQAYVHVYPNDLQCWGRKVAEFIGDLKGVPRFRRLNR